MHPYTIISKYGLSAILGTLTVNGFRIRSGARNTVNGFHSLGNPT